MSNPIASQDVVIDASTTQKVIIFKKHCLEKFTKEVMRIFPQKAFGYFLSSQPFGDPEEYIMFQDNSRDDYNELFENYGNYYVTNKAGFVSTPEETFKAERYMREKGLYKVGVYHSHQRHPALLSSIDADLHPSKHLWHLLISLRNPEIPRIKIFSVVDGIISERKFI